MPPVVRKGRQPCHKRAKQCPQNLGWRNCYLDGLRTSPASWPASLQPLLRPASLMSSKNHSVFIVPRTILNIEIHLVCLIKS